MILLIIPRIVAIKIRDVQFNPLFLPVRDNQDGSLVPGPVKLKKATSRKAMLKLFL